MLSQFGIEASRAAQYVIAFAIILVLVALFGLVLRKLTGGRLMMNGQDRARARQPRLGVVDIYDLDRQRQLVLLRRDNVEHLLLIGGLNDVVIETNIVRVAGARIPASAVEQGADRFEPAFEPTRPQVETPGRPSIETQLAAQLGTFVRRSTDEPAEEEAAPPPPPPAMAETPRPEPVLKPETPVFGAAPTVSGFRSPPEAPAVRPEQRPSYMPPMFQSRPTPTPPVAPAPVMPPPAPPSFPAEPVRVSEDLAGERGPPDAAILSDMAKQLEEALKRPATPLSPQDERTELASAAIEDNPDLDDDDLLEPPPAPGTQPEVETPVILTEEVTEEIVVASTEETDGPIAPAPPGDPAGASGTRKGRRSLLGGRDRGGIRPPLGPPAGYRQEGLTPHHLEQKRAPRRSPFFVFAVGGRSIVPVDPLVPLMALLRFERQCGDGAGFQPLQRDRFPGFLAIAVAAVVDPRDGGVDLGDQFALPVAGAEFDGPVGFRRGPVRQIRVILVLVLKGGQGFLGLLQNVALPTEKLAPEIFPLPLVHERLGFGRSITLGDINIRHVGRFIPMYCRAPIYTREVGHNGVRAHRFV